MRTKIIPRQPPKRYETRIVERFLWFPKTLTTVNDYPYPKERRWLETAKIVQHYGYYPDWDNGRWMWMDRNWWNGS